MRKLSYDPSAYELRVRTVENGFIVNCCLNSPFVFASPAELSTELTLFSQQHPNSLIGRAISEKLKREQKQMQKLKQNVMGVVPA